MKYTITIIRKYGDWTCGHIRQGNKQYSFQVKTVRKKAIYGIDEGRIIKLFLITTIGCYPLAVYERGWEKLPCCEEHQGFTQALIDRFN